MRLGARNSQKSLNLALQGGGAHGAFTWGVLDKLLEDGRIRFDAISGTSAGAMNAVAYADGIMQNGAQGARDNLRKLWEAIGQAARYSPLRRTPLDILMGNWSLSGSPGLALVNLFHQFSSPYAVNPLNLNPVAEILGSVVDFDRVRKCDQVELYISATNVETGRVRVFNRAEINCQMVMASAALPHMFQAVEIDGVPYWDGGYMGNPVLFPFYRSKTADILIVQINPIEREGTPRTAREIFDRVTEITFNASLLHELRMIDFVRQLADEGKLKLRNAKAMRIHLIDSQDELSELGAASRLNAQSLFLDHLFELGRGRAQRWLDAHFDDLGKRATVDLRAMFEGIGGTPETAD